MRPENLKTKILLDSGDPAETARIKNLLGFLDGQTTNPSLVAKNPEIAAGIAAGHKLDAAQADAAYRKIVEAISPLVGDGGVSIEVYADQQTTAEQMFKEGQEKFSWVPNAYIKYPCLPEGLRAAEMSVAAGIRVNMTLVFSQQQAAAVYAATRGSKEPVYVSPFIGRLDDRGENGMDLVKNILQMYAAGDGHVKVLAASIRHYDHLNACLQCAADLATVPAKVLEEWQTNGLVLPDSSYIYGAGSLRPIVFESIDLGKKWDEYDLKHELTDKGIEKFVADYKSTIG